MMRKLTNEEFKAKAIKVHGQKYRYDLSEYKTGKQKVVIICDVHGEFSIQPDNLLQGQGCYKCTLQKTSDRCKQSQSDFIYKAKLVHGDKFDYSKVDYERSWDKVTVICKSTLKEFSITPNNHTRGVGCSCCSKSGFKRYESAYLYVLRDGFMTKVGISNNHPRYRASRVNISGNHKFKVHTYFKFEEGADASKLEQHTLKYLQSRYPRVCEVFDGWTECFTNVDIDDLLNFINNNITPKEQ